MRLFILTSAVATTLLIGQASVRSSGSQSSLAQPTSFPLVEVQELVLDNGFKVLVVEGSQVPRVAASLWYRLGSLQERIGEHGSTHFLEHVVHQGTTTVGTKNFKAEKSLLRQIYETEQKLLAARNRERNRLRQRDVFFGDLDWPTTPEIEQLRRRLYELEDEDAQYREFWAEYNWYRRYGAVSRHTDPVPATTGHEQLEIDIDMPRESIELLFRLEADRMANAVLRGWEAQRFTVLEQILGGRQRAADPRGRFYEVINGVTGVVHPMFRRSGGHLRDFAFYSRASMLRMYDDYFVPNNATLVLVGDITRSEVELLAKQYFGRIPRGAEPPAWMDLEAEVVPGGAIRLDWSEPVDPRVLVRYRIPGVGHPVPSIYSSARPELDKSPVCQHHAGMISSLVRTLISAFKARRELALEKVALRQQLAVLRRSVKRPRRIGRTRTLRAGRMLRIFSQASSLRHPGRQHSLDERDRVQNPR